MLEDALRARMVVAFGEGEELRLLNTFQKMLRRLVLNVWEIRDADAWKTFDVESKPFIEKLDDIRHQLERLMLQRALFPGSSSGSDGVAGTIPGTVTPSAPLRYPRRHAKPATFFGWRRKRPGGLTGLQNRVVPPCAGWKVRLLPFSAICHPRPAPRAPRGRSLVGAAAPAGTCDGSGRSSASRATAAARSSISKTSRRLRLPPATVDTFTR
jgi:hypothetical protein